MLFLIPLFVELALGVSDLLPPPLGFGCGRFVVFPYFEGGLAQQVPIVLQAGGIDALSINGIENRAPWLRLMLTVCETTIAREGDDVFECGVETSIGLPRLLFAHARSVDEERTAR